MSDIIQDAKQLLDGATPGPWVIDSSIDPDYPELQAAPRVENGILMVPVLIHDIYGEVSSVEDAELIAAAPEMAQVLAEDSYEYIVQVHREGRWQFYIGESISPTDKPGLAVGFLQEKYAREFAKIETEYPTRIVRRRVSPVEVVND